jgi:hypothetical protein
VLDMWTPCHPNRRNTAFTVSLGNFFVCPLVRGRFLARLRATLVHLLSTVKVHL